MAIKPHQFLDGRHQARVTEGSTGGTARAAQRPVREGLFSRIKKALVGPEVQEAPRRNTANAVYYNQQNQPYSVTARQNLRGLEVNGNLTSALRPDPSRATAMPPDPALDAFLRHVIGEVS